MNNYKLQAPYEPNGDQPEAIKKLFDQTFIDLARSVYFTNDERAKVKNDINKTFGSELVEVKSYEEY